MRRCQRAKQCNCLRQKTHVQAVQLSTKGHWTANPALHYRSELLAGSRSTACAKAPSDSLQRWTFTPNHPSLPAANVPADGHYTHGAGQVEFKTSGRCKYVDNILPKCTTISITGLCHVFRKGSVFTVVLLWRTLCIAKSQTPKHNYEACEPSLMSFWKPIVPFVARRSRINMATTYGHRPGKSDRIRATNGFSLSEWVGKTGLSSYQKKLPKQNQVQLRKSALQADLDSCKISQRLQTSLWARPRLGLNRCPSRNLHGRSAYPMISSSLFPD